MRIKDVVTLKEVVSDLNDGKAFYDQRETGVGDYFWDSLIADIESLRIYAGIHNKRYGLHRMLAKRFPYALYYEIEDEIAYIVAILPMDFPFDQLFFKIKNRVQLLVCDVEYLIVRRELFQLKKLRQAVISRCKACLLVKIPFHFKDPLPQ